jgi:glutamate:Na+ symporter, ESS family
MEQWTTIIYFLLIAALIFVGKFLKTSVPLLNRIVIPTALLGGMIGLVISLVFAPVFSNPMYVEVDQQGRYIETIDQADVINTTELSQDEFEALFESDDAINKFTELYKTSYYNREVTTYYQLEDDRIVLLLSKETTFFNVNVIESIVYHALAIGFLALALKRSEQKEKGKYWSTGMLITSTYALQAVIGILLVFIFFSDQFIGSGMLVALGFGQGPGLAMSIGSGWNQFLNGYGTTLGASYAFLGFVFGGTVGVVIINIFSRRKGFVNSKQYDESPSQANVTIDTVREISLLDGLTQQFVVIGVIYGLVYLTLFGLNILLASIGGAGAMIFGLLRGFNFIIAILYALLYKSVLNRLEAKGKNIRFLTNNYVLSNIASFAFNIMITGSVLAITLAFLSTYGIQLITTSILAGTATFFYLRFMTKRIYKDFQDEFSIGLFGMLTGVASTGLALLKGLDPELKTPVAEEMVVGSGTAILIALPLFVLLFIPSFTYGTENETLFNFITFFGILLYVIIFASILIFKTRKK